MAADRELVAFVPTLDQAVARAFYEGVLGLAVEGVDPGAVVFDAGGVMLRVTVVGGLEPQPFTVLGWKVADIAATVDDYVGRGVVFERFEGMPQDDRGIWTTPGGDRVAWFKDPDGNVLSLTEFVSSSSS